MVGSVPTSDIGGLDSILGGWVDDWLEILPDLQWPASVRTYAKMRHDPQLAGILAAYTLPIRRATWQLDPAGCRDEVVQLVADDLGLPIKGVDAKPTGARRRGISWAEHIRLALLSLVFGHMVFERRYEIRRGQARLVALGERMPHTIADIELAPDGTIRSVSQDIAGGGRPIPADRLAWYVHSREGANWAGRSIMRASYGPWLLKHELWRINATSIRRFGMGIPAVEAPPGATAGQIAEAQKLASAMRAGDQAGIGLPPNFKLSLTGMSGSAPDALAFITYLDQQMSRSALAGLMDLGTTPNGSRALGESFLDLFLLSLQSIADEVADVATSGHPTLPGVVTQLVDFNFGEDEPAPRVIAADVGTRHEVTAEALQMLLAVGAITADDELEAYIRQAMRLPEKAEDSPPRRPPNNPGPEPEPDADPDPDPATDPEPGAEETQQDQHRRPARRRARAAGRRRPRAAAGERRQLTLDEARSGVDPDAIQTLWQEALDALIAAWASISQAWRDTLAELVKTAVDAGDLPGLAQMQLDAADAEQFLIDAMTDLAAASAEQMAEEAAAQQVTVEPPPVDEGHLGAIAAALAVLLAVWLGGAAAREALRLAIPGAVGEEVADAVTEHLENLSDAFLREQLGGALSTAQMSGRLAVLEAAPVARYQGLEVLDTNTCSPCRDIDGHVFDGLAEAKAAYAPGGYIDCQGRLRCRGTVIAIWTQEE
ncbi:phage portal protein family protein [Nonomuraea fuscirosea]|uniref:phage portal protein family protein n=1 Tax=Nonomuraea fuscirosea TaxID=1291556 RepID=UPI0033D68E79